METLIKPQFITNEKGEKTGVYLLMDDFDRLLDEIEDLEDAKAFEMAMNREDKEFIPFDQALEEMKKERGETKE